MSTNDERIQRAKKKAHEYDQYSGCSQSVLLSLQEELGIGNNEVFKAATVLSGGIARRGETCGAIIGALMTLNLLIGREKMEETEVYREAMEPCWDLINRFKDQLAKQLNFEKGLDSTLCREIQENLFGRSFDMTDPDGYQEFIDAGGHSDSGCFQVCGIAAQVGAEKILEIMQHRDAEK
jgi:C_GCAxxG_C_C family probable redox protein